MNIIKRVYATLCWYARSPQLYYHLSDCFLIKVLDKEEISSLRITQIRKDTLLNLLCRYLYGATFGLPEYHIQKIYRNYHC